MANDTMARNLTGLLLLGGLAVIAAAWGFQLIGGYVPCKLCLEQRIPYYAGLPLTALALVLIALRRTGFAMAVLLVVAALFAYGAGLGVYQAGAEWQFWDGPNDCGGGSAAPSSATNMLQALQSTRVVSCTEASWRMLGLSFAGWNAVASAGLAGLALISAALLKRRRNAVDLGS
ncbi:disulfide bond formation protein B [Roseibium salinum]|uniref:Disulfide bond formation protein B n=1 Tax=Roseibium salinum TaxID=1604349 RepID=A0ABT3R6S9_9HYPH|nr:disulfide bond formation protein B [Roseibium sp. DSM 29163]MCX2725001.1 disulfide bond formation protein B [Roseibium sp. DSM 29163]MDN3721076.1 disulfide bond formation protein B [Roseibium salinum]